MISSLLATAFLILIATSTAFAQQAPLCDDNTFVRRASLDLIGRIPTVDERESFLSTGDRAAFVDQLLDHPEHARFWSQHWATLLVGRFPIRETDRELLRAWIEQSILADKPLDRMAFELISASGVSTLDGPTNYMIANRDDQVLRLGRVFLGVQLDCTKCHDHPTQRWTNADYVAMERFFRPLRFREVSGGVEVYDEGNLSSDAELPQFLSGREPLTSAWRRELALMVVQSKPFSRAMVQRAWHWTMGGGISGDVDAVDRDSNPIAFASLEQLSERFRSSRFDLDELLREICLSPGYQSQVALDAANDSPSSEWEPQRATRMLLPEQWIASVAILTNANTANSRPPSAAELSEQTRELLGQPQSTLGSDPFDRTPTSQQTLRGLNRSVSSSFTQLDKLFLAAWGRPPTDAERESLGTLTSDQSLFVIIQSNPFLLNQ
ncbi:DUF1549 domain-containing protein [Stieleria varia]|uniref:DUF1549 domain-containing protein n=1 Tax=Stieleria varia TaxID=2528005 RepID=A0A5C6AGN6_9BACT|nr:DUF1549 domain-containing protein [Stieleria varia]TWT98468.1 hypothetical protein Pla52n_49820 [Stieleria varia]